MSNETTASHALYYSMQMEHLIRMCREIGVCGDKLANLRILHREVSARLAQVGGSSLGASEIVVLQNRVSMDTALLRSVIETDMIRKLAGVMELCEQIPATLNNLPSIKTAMDSEKNNESS